ncbi:VOC family protein [Paraflavitalea pollutisoli]|uniref:VOC family protein n=1 Tax=Paraflavitalea pollutisoli TaxID=3034143 RepID=UPI0023EA987F|nr:VOC family protein [Paraflavitalea sp. H1-2-19X]
MRINNITLLVNDFDRAYAFYHDILELTCTWGKPGENFASFSLGDGAGIAIFKAELMAMALPGYQAKQAGAQGDSTMILVQVDNVQDAYTKLSQKGVVFIDTPQDMAAWGIRVVHFRDTENNLFELYSELPKEQWSEGLQENAKQYTAE